MTFQIPGRCVSVFSLLLLLLFLLLFPSSSSGCLCKGAERGKFTGEKPWGFVNEQQTQAFGIVMLEAFDDVFDRGVVLTHMTISFRY
jgi:hypothetical protein